jgi:hypothetical protein
MKVPASSITALGTALFRTLWPHARRVYEERKAGRASHKQEIDLLNAEIDKTLNRIRGGQFDSLWQTVINYLGHQIIMPDYLRKPTLIEWISNPAVAEGLKEIARTQVLGITDHQAETEQLLHKTYSGTLARMST